MTSSVDLSVGLQDWVRLAGMDLTQGSRTQDGRTVIWNKGGEIRYFINSVGSYYVITTSDRMGPEYFNLAALTMGLIEKYLYGRFGGSVRKREGLTRIQKPFSRDELKPGYRFGTVTFAGRERDSLIDGTGSMAAIAADDRLVEISHYIDVPIETIKDSFLDADGKPLFATLA
ncbi:MAG: TNT antitoxin family protein [Mycobacterium sp.]|uniref:TNT antitoxin family protein n=1 Tax=Mycobacterium sp. TaxID=1785 RepID=UPI001ED324D4|nr:TNT antitoxin family protein [Mycobacterium sp.]MBV8789866.1 TNT antitoxin family protein [Mycobacterium sp.]